MFIELPPGVVSKRSKRSNVANWQETNLIRWDETTMEPVGGWEQLTYSGMASPIRKMHRWSDNAGSRYTAFLCEQHCYVDVNGTLTDITPVGGLTPVDNTDQGGFGDTSFGTGTFGDARDAVNRFDVATPMYSLDNWGQELRVMTSSDGRLLRWDPATPATPLAAVTNAPINNRCFVVTDERHIILFGAGGDKHRFEWCDEEDDTNWTAGTTSKAGGYSVEPASPIVTASKTPFGTVFFTNRSAYVVEWQGLPYVYDYRAVSACPPPYSPDSLGWTPEGLFWASMNGFWMYNGVDAAPIDCPIWDWIDERINIPVSRFRAVALTVGQKFETWWFFVSGSSTAENNYVVIYNYKNKVWSQGMVGRTAGVSTPNDPSPIMATADTVYKHESGYAYPGAAELPWAETFTLNAMRGRNLSTMKQMIPELDGDYSAVQFKMVKRNNPSDDADEVLSSAKPVRSNGYVDVRETSRDMRIRVEMIKEAYWTLGPIDAILGKRGQK